MLGGRGMIQKRCFYERSARVPLVFSFPEKWKEGTRIPDAASLVDLLPTLADLAGVEPPQGLPGNSLLPSVTTNEGPGKRIIFSEYHGEGVHAPCFMALKDTNKYVYIHGYEECLYDLKEDPHEFTNVIGDKRYSSIHKELKSALLKKFDPDEIAIKARRSQKNRRFIHNSESGK